MSGRVRKQIPDKEEFSNLCLKEKYSQDKLAVYYSSSLKTIRFWILQHQLPLKPKGGGNNRKYNPNKDQIQHLVDEGNTYSEIAKILGMSLHSLGNWARKLGVVRYKNIPEYQRYKTKVYHLTEKTYVENFEELNPHKYPRTLCGIGGGYQIDHIQSVRKCFDMGWTAEQCSHKSNLQLITWQDNLQKRTWSEGYGK